MDAKEPIHLLEIYFIPTGFEWKIAEHLPRIEYFSVITGQYDACEATNGLGHKLRSRRPFYAVCGNKNYTRKLKYSDCNHVFRELKHTLLSNLSRNDHVKRLKLDVYNGFGGLELINQVSTLTELYMTFHVTEKVDFQITLPLQKVYLNAVRPRRKTLDLGFYVEDAFETRYIRELCLESVLEFKHSLKDNLESSFPKLKNLGLCVNDGLFYDLHSFSHGNLQVLIIATTQDNRHYPVPHVASLFHSFPKASIHWWDSLLIRDYKGGAYKLDTYSMLSPTLPFAVVGLYCLTNSGETQRSRGWWSSEWGIKPGTYAAKPAEGKRNLDVLFKQIYEDKELKKISQNFC
ncbi:hypothetical protein KGF57_004394 [Candida theae]|uniref:Uncharacterized protein n=1 Tax=Candida theae TaxID=1198502 RepID=A0AAD5FX68_9ASCO|nr:uncharacterized protein KGF57_004394 [Candida theae]KAI5950227.1 hypothetical protein KGF57_004394 [Candida theae]